MQDSFAAFQDGCSEAYSKEDAISKLIGRWQLIAQGCGYCANPVISKSNDPVTLIVESATLARVIKDTGRVDSSVFVFNIDPSNRYHWLSQDSVYQSNYLFGGLTFCNDLIGFDSRAGDGPIYVFQKSK